MSPYEQDVILPLVRRLNETGAILSARLAVEINRSERMARVYLSRLEKAGAVCRPKGKRKGWMVVEFQLRVVQGSVS